MTVGYKRIQRSTGSLQSVTWVTRGSKRLGGLRRVTRGYMKKHWITRGYRGFQGVTGDYKGLQKVRRGYKRLQGVIRVC